MCVCLCVRVFCVLAPEAAARQKNAQEVERERRDGRKEKEKTEQDMAWAEAKHD